MSEERFFIEMAPYMVAIVTIVMTFMFLMVRTIFRPRQKRRSKKEQHQMDVQVDPNQLNDLLHRCSKLSKRVENLEEIIRTEHARID